MSGRREAQIHSDARLLGQTSYIYEAGCAMVIDNERTYLTGSWVPDHSGAPADRIVASGIPERLFERFRPDLEWHAPWHEGRELSLLFRGRVDVDEVNAEIADAGGEDLRFLDNGAISRPMPGIDVAHAYHLVPGGASKGKAVGAHMRARGYAPEECIAAGDSIEDLGAAEFVGRFFCVANGPENDDELRAALRRLRQRHRDRGPDGRRRLRVGGLDARGALKRGRLGRLPGSAQPGRAAGARGRGARPARLRLLPLGCRRRAHARPQPDGVRRARAAPQGARRRRRDEPRDDRARDDPPPPGRDRADRVPPAGRPEGEVASARGAADAGALFCLSSLSNTPMEEVAAGGEGARAGSSSTSSATAASPATSSPGRRRAATGRSC